MKPQWDRPLAVSASNCRFSGTHSSQLQRTAQTTHPARHNGDSYSFSSENDVSKLADKLCPLKLTLQDLQYLASSLKDKKGFANEDKLYHAGKLKDGRAFIITQQDQIYLGKPNHLKRLNQVESKHFRYQDSSQNYEEHRTLGDDSTESLLITVTTKNNQKKAEISKILTPKVLKFPMTYIYTSLPISSELQLNSM